MLRDNLGKNVFKKSVKLTVSVVPTQTAQHLHTTPADSGGNDVGESIIFDGKTFTVTFSQISGELKLV